MIVAVRTALRGRPSGRSPDRRRAHHRMERVDSGNTVPMQVPGVHIETLHNPTRYSHAQIEKACTIAAMLNRGKLVLVEPPRR